MPIPNSTVARPKRGRLFRWTRNAILIILVLVVAAAIAGASYQAIETRADALRFPQEGRSVDVGGHKLSIHCTGQGSPTVILDSGLGVPAIGWRSAQSEIAKFTRVCSYDRAGYGWSDPGPMPRTSAQIVKELHALLQNAGERPPYILVGHSFGGYNVRVYNGQYPDEVAGMVLVDASHEDQVALMPPAAKKYFDDQEKQLKTEQMIAPVLIRLGVARFMANKQEPPKGVSKDLLEESLYLTLTPKFAEATASELGSFDESAKQVRSAGTLGEKPLVVLTAGQNADEKDLPKGFPKQAFEDFHVLWVNDLQMREAHLSTRGKRILVPDSTHMIPFERPDTIVNAVREVYAAVNSPQARDEFFPRQ